MKNYKRMFALLLAAAMMMALAACGGKDNNHGGSQGNSNTTMGEAAKTVFEENADKDPETVGQLILEHPAVALDGMVVPVEPGFLMGFDADIEGFRSGVSFGPVIGTIPFIGYIFELEEGADVDAFVADLEAKANLRWNVCTEAEEMVTAKEGNTVFFLMCPKSMESAE